MSTPKELIQVLDHLNVLQEQLEKGKDDILEDTLISIEEALLFLNDFY